MEMSAATPNHAAAPAMILCQRTFVSEVISVLNGLTWMTRMEKMVAAMNGKNVSMVAEKSSRTEMPVNPLCVKFVAGLPSIMT